MMDRNVSITDLALIAVTRAALGVGIGFLLAGKLTGDQRKAAGIALAVVGAITTIPLIVGITSAAASNSGQRHSGSMAGREFPKYASLFRSGTGTAPSLARDVPDRGMDLFDLLIERT